MLCRNPFMAGAVPFGCGQCLPCRVNRRRQWMWRQYLESLCHEENCFVTLTYDQAHIPGNWSLEPRVLQLFLKSFRRSISPVRVRFFAVGEYGEQSMRPHYHLSLFGVSGYSVVPGGTVADRIQQSWGRGFTSCYEFNHLTAQYVAGYTVKKLTDRKARRVWNVGEFARVSNRPGLGARAMETLGRTLLDTYQDWGSGDVPGVLRVGSRSIPLGRYLLSRLRNEVGFTPELQKEIRDRVSFERSIDMQAVLDVQKGDTFKASFLKDIEGELEKVEARARLFRKRGNQ